MFKGIKRGFVFLALVCFVTASAYALDADFQPTPIESGYAKVEQGKLYYQTFGQGSPIIVLHGGPGLDQSYLLPQMLELAKNHTLIFYDQRGSGKSLDVDKSLSQMTTQQFVEDLEALRKDLQLDTFALMGHSWGGFLAMKYSIDYPEHVSKLMLLSSAPADYKGQEAFLNDFAKRTEPIQSEIQPLFNFEDFKKLSESEISKVYRTLFTVYFYDQSDVQSLTLTMSKPSALSGFQVGQDMSKTSWLKPEINLFPELKNLKVPTLVMHGEKDLVPLWTAQEITEAIPNAQMVSLEKCGHFPYIEQPALMFEQIEEFMNEDVGTTH